MSEAKGMLKTCDRCGETIFLKTIGDGKADGGGGVCHCILGQQVSY